MSDSVDAILAAGPPSRERMRATIAALHRAMPTPQDPVDSAALLTLLRILYRVARHDLPLARLFEGHVDAVQIVARYGDGDLVDDVMAQSRGGGRVRGVERRAAG